MDDLLSKLRKDSNKSINSQKSSAGTQEDASHGKSMNSAQPNLNNSANPPEIIDLISPIQSSQQPIEIHTSQSENLPNTRFKLDFDLLEQYRTENSMYVSEIKRTVSYKIERPFFGLIKAVEVFGDDVYKWEICDETGIIYASAYVKKYTVKLGNVIHLTDCSIWNFSENHLNIVDENIRKVYL